MNAAIVKDVGALEPLPDDLRVWLGEQELRGIACEVAELTEMPEFYFDSAGCIRLNGKMMLALLSYCYAVNCCGSEEVQWAMQEEFAARRICNGTCLDWRSIRNFRIKNRGRIEQCLVRMSVAAAAQKFLSADCELKHAIPMDEILAWAQRKIGLANLFDAAATD